MLLQTNSYVVPKERRVEHARLLRRFRQALQRLGCDHFEVYEQVGANWSAADATGRYVQIMRFRDRKHQLEVQAAERNDPTTQALLREFCELINLPYQQQQGLFAIGFYTSFLRMPPARTATELGAAETTDHAAEPADHHAHQEHEHASQTESQQPAGVLSMDTSGEDTSAEETSAVESSPQTDADAELQNAHSAESAEETQVEETTPEEPTLDETQIEDADSNPPVVQRFELDPDDTDSPIPFTQENEIVPEDSDDTGSTSAAVTEDVNGEDDESASHPER